MNRRPSVRAGFGAAFVGAAMAYLLVAVSLLAASPAMALNRDDGDDPGPGMSNLKILGIFVGIPVLSMALIWILVSIPSMMRGPRYRPGKEWQAGSEWYGGPGDEVEGGSGAAELEAGQSDTGQSDTGQSDTGQSDTGRSDTALTGTVVEPREGDGGGTSARW